MQVSPEQTNPSTIVLDVTMDPQEVARAFDTVYREFSRHVNVPGFRPGKAPRAIVERYVNADKVRERALDKLIRDSYAKALEEQGITPYALPDIEPTDLEDKKPFSYKATVPLEPQVTLGEYIGLAVERPVIPVTDEMVERRLEKIRLENARVERVTDRGVERGDVLIAENKIVLEGQEDGAAPRRQIINVGNNIPGFDDAILGMMPNEERTFELTYPDDYDEEDRRGKRATFTVHLNSISAKRMPDLDDAFAQKVAHVETIEDLRAGLKATMELESARLSDQIVEQRLIQQIHDGATLYYPDSLVRDEFRDDWQRLLEQLASSRVTYEDYLRQTGQTSDELRDKMVQQAVVSVRTSLVLRQIAQQERMQASEADIDAELDRLLESSRVTEEQAEEYRSVPSRRAQIAGALIQQQLRDFLFTSNTITDVEQAAPADVEAPDESDTQSE
jgi:trigger factor